MTSNPFILAGDIGGTKTRLALCKVVSSQVEVVHEVQYASHQYETFEHLLADFGGQFPLPARAAFGVAGPVTGGEVRTTNLPWRINAQALQAQFGFAVCRLLNDLEATAWGIAALAPADFFELQAGAPDARGHVAVIAAGTGLGEAGLYWNGKRHIPYSTEGGHASFCPRDETDFALLRHLQARTPHVSWERVVSGMGLLDLHAFLREYRQTPVPDWLAQAMQDTAPAAAISAAAMAGRDALCSETLRRFVRHYGAEAGNLALKLMSSGGVYIGGGIAPKILPLLQDGLFLEAFQDKGRMQPLLAAMPVRIILNDRAALYGPALAITQS